MSGYGFGRSVRPRTPLKDQDRRVFKSAPESVTTGGHIAPDEGEMLRRLQSEFGLDDAWRRNAD